MDEAERCDHVALLDGGRIVALDQPAALQRTLAGRIVGLRASDSRRALEVLAGTPGVRRAVLFGDIIHVTMSEASDGRQVVRAALAGAGIEGMDYHEVEPSLEDVFMDRMAA
jgi:ABC-2 type transport system ATP-binding protein